MSRSLTVWISPLDSPGSLDEAIATVMRQAASISSGPRQYGANLLLATHYGQWPQSECTQNLPDDMRVATVDDITRIRGVVEARGMGFGVWGVPVDGSSMQIAAEHAAAGGYYVANFEPGPAFWAPGDDAKAIDDWWGGFWNGLPDGNAMDGNVGVTVIPNDWGMQAFHDSFSNLIGGANLILMESYGGPNTPEYPYPDLWPVPSAATVQALKPGKPIACILSNLNLAQQATQANRIGNGNLHSWYARPSGGA